MMLVLVGPHGAGKSTLGARLSERLGIPFHGEIGRELAEDPRWRPGGVTAEDNAHAFDQEVFLRELSRDLSFGGEPRIVETWHPGNLAYATRRSPLLAASWLDALRRACRASTVMVQPVTAATPTLAHRQSEPGSLAFFQDVGRDALRWAVAMGLPCLPPVHTDHRGPAACADLVFTRLARLPTLTTQPWRMKCARS